MSEPATTLTTNWRDPFFPDDEPQPKPKKHISGYEKRINKLTHRNHILEARYAELEARNQSLESEIIKLKAQLEERLYAEIAALNRVKELEGSSHACR